MQALASLPCFRRVLLSGTPMQVWSLTDTYSVSLDNPLDAWLLFSLVQSLESD